MSKISSLYNCLTYKQRIIICVFPIGRQNGNKKNIFEENSYFRYKEHTDYKIIRD